MARLHRLAGALQLARHVHQAAEIAAKQQIETYAEIMRIPVSLVESAEELRKNIKPEDFKIDPKQMDELRHQMEQLKRQMEELKALGFDGRV